LNFQQACYFRLGEHTLALGGDTLRQIVTVGRVTPVPRTGPELLGLFTVRGLVVPLIDLRPIFDPAATRARVTERAALVEVDHHQIAFCLDDVYGFFPVQETFDPKTVDPGVAAYTLKLATHDNLTAAVINVNKVMAALERQLVVA